jgi:hypothetical protein
VEGLRALFCGHPKAGSLRNALARMAAAAFFRYDYREAYAGKSNLGGLAFWLLLWLVVDLAAYSFFEGISWWWLFGGPASVVAATLLLPPPVMLALASLQVLRSVVSLAVGCLGYAHAPLWLLTGAITVIQLWTLAADVWLLLAYLRTPKREVSWRKENPQA